MVWRAQSFDQVTGRLVAPRWNQNKYHLTGRCPEPEQQSVRFTSVCNHAQDGVTRLEHADGSERWVQSSNERLPVPRSDDADFLSRHFGAVRSSRWPEMTPLFFLIRPVNPRPAPHPPARPGHASRLQGGRTVSRARNEPSGHGGDGSEHVHRFTQFRFILANFTRAFAFLCPLWPVIDGNNANFPVNNGNQPRHQKGFSG